MGLPTPKYVQIAGIQDPAIHYIWDDWNVEAADMPLDEELLEQLNQMSHRAIVAFTIGTAEWIIHRFGRLSVDPWPRQYLEAAWGQVVDFCYSVNRDIKVEDWAGPIRGPVGVAIRRVMFAVQQAATNGDPAWRAGRASKLAEHVIGNAAPYRSWREGTIKHLTNLYPFDPEEPLGEVVPWQVLDADTHFRIDETEALINDFLRGLDWRTNSELNSPKEMLAQGFQGRPYFFDIKQDRRRRFEW